MEGVIPMLVLSRQRDETIMIGDDIEISVVDIRGDKVKLGINAPIRVAVHRKEVYEAIRQENEQAARAVGADVPTIRRPVGPGGKLKRPLCTCGHAHDPVPLGLVPCKPPKKLVA